MLYPTTQDYQCEYEIDRAGVSIRRFAGGLDSFQALQLVFIAIGAELVYIERRTGMRLEFSNGELGFPRP
jgi:hypothetical protein